LLLFVLACGGEQAEPDPSTTRVTRGGEIIGVSLSGGAVHAWRGIPYARPPVGPLRWQPPAPPRSWEGRFAALESGTPCSQLGGDPVMGDEDCLYLDVYAPAGADEAASTQGERKPVLYWIHGGGNSMGAGHQLPPQRLAAEHDVVVVTINYRLGVFGWLSHPALRASAEGPEAASGNFGTLDMIRGLEWVQRNIDVFRGDPDRVTIFGESAGGVDVYSLLLSPRARGLFHAAISQSGMPRTATRAEAEHYVDARTDARTDSDADADTEGVAPGRPGSSGELLLALLQEHRGATDRESAKRLAEAMDSSETERFLRGLSSEQILGPFARAVGDRPMPVYLTPTVIRDGAVIPDVDPIEAFSTPGGYNAVPFIAGTNREESKLFLALSSPHVSRVFGLPVGLESKRLYDVEAEYGGLVWRLQGVDEPIAAMRTSQGPTVWAYRFDWDEEGSVLGVDLSDLIGAAHAVELLFVFGLTDLGIANHFLFEDRESAERLSRQMRSYWTHFARTLRPGDGGIDDLPEWQPWNPAVGGAKYLVFDSMAEGGLEHGTDRIDRRFVLERVFHDPRLFDDAERCGVLRNMVHWSTLLTAEEYERIDEGACRAHPLESSTHFPSLPARPERPEASGREEQAERALPDQSDGALPGRVVIAAD